MAVQFALRPRINLDRPVPRRRLAGLKVHPLALPIGGYWLAIAGLMYAVLDGTRHPTRSAAVDDESKAHLQSAHASADPLANPVPAHYSKPVLAVESTSRGVAEREGDSERHASSKQSAARPALVPRGEEPQVPLADRGTVESRRPTPPPPAEEPASPSGETVKQSAEKPATLRSAPSEAPLPKTSLPSCESAAASAQQTIDFRGSRGAPDLTRDAFAAVLEHGAYLDRCAIPARTAIEICAAVQDGRVVGVSVRTEPQRSAIDSCIRGAVAALRFPQSARLDITRTRFEGQ